MIEVDAVELVELRDEIRALRDEIRSVRISPLPEWITAKYHAERAGVTPRTVRNWIASGELETYHHGKTTMIRANQMKRK
ncbi:MAG: helix-turn-helix domain-containing protein [Paracoccus sp.]|nr:helix-turn-helix domain-containing protein [Paracoccus sp. (in: a-proteobacteria)]